MPHPKSDQNYPSLAHGRVPKTPEMSKINPIIPLTFTRHCDAPLQGVQLCNPCERDVKQLQAGSVYAVAGTPVFSGVGC